MTTKSQPSILAWLMGGWGKYVVATVLVLWAAESPPWRTPALLLLGALVLYELVGPRPK